jgi:hypothetical protein
MLTRHANCWRRWRALSMDDEPFLERALDDRDAQVRHKAAALLASLPESRLVRRMIATAGDILTLDGGHLTPSFPPAIPRRWCDGVRDHHRPPWPSSVRGCCCRLWALSRPGMGGPVGATPEEIVRAAGLGRCADAARRASAARHPTRAGWRRFWPRRLEGATGAAGPVDAGRAAGAAVGGTGRR